MNKNESKRAVFSLFILFAAAIISCNKLVQVPQPISSVTTAQVFSTDANASAAMLGIYSYMSENQSFSNLFATYYPGESADELTDEPSGSESQDPFLTNSLTALYAGINLSNFFWQPAYYDIYNANAVISGVQASVGITTAAKTRLIAEAKFIRAFCYFYLTNLYGNLPLILSIDFNQTVLLAQTPEAKIYQQIIADLIDGQNELIGDFSLSGGEPIRANKWAATALLARVYLYQQNWTGADSAASAVINSGQFRLLSNLDSVFLANSKEAILQLQTVNNSPYATWEGNFFIPSDSTSSANCWLTSQLLGAFEPNDMRRSNWVDSTDFNGTYYYYPYKYQIRVGTSYPSMENYTLLRLAEQYLIRAEAEANLGQLSAAINDVDSIRARAGLPNLSNSLTQSQVLAAVQQEDRIEFFAELGHRWFDLKRWGIALQTLSTISYKKGNIDSTQLLYPISIGEIQTDPNLTQNPGY